MKTDLIEIFQTIRAELQPYAALGFQPRINSEEAYDLWNEGEFMMDGRVRKEIFFASVVLKKAYVVVYFMPIYVDPELQSEMATDLLKLLKGKSCFHFKKIDDLLREQFADALAEGFKLYKQKQWV